MNKIEQLYFYWLCDFVCDSIKIRRYRSVLEHLYFKDYRWILEMDENLEGWGLYLRERYIDESPSGRIYSKISDIFDRRCSVLEVMVAISINMEDKIASNEDFGNRTSEWFWDMFCSLGLDFYNENTYNEPEIDDILDNFLDRKASKGRYFTLFKLKCGVKKASKTMDFWQQAMNYLSDVMENNGEIW